MRFVLLFIVCLVGGIIGWNQYKASQHEIVEFRTADVRQARIVEAVSVTGFAEPMETRVVEGELPGVVEAVYVDFNDEVKKGAVLAQLKKESQDFELRRAENGVETARLAQEAAKISESLAQEGVKQASSVLHDAMAQVKRLEGLSEQSRTQAQLDAANSDVVKATAALNAARERVRQAELEIRRADQALDLANLAVETAKWQIEKAKLKAPMDGFILNKNIKVGETLGRPRFSLNEGASSLFEISAPLDRMRAIVKVSEADLGRVKVGQTASLNVDAYPDVDFNAKVKIIRNTPTSDRTAVTYAAVLEFDNKRDPQTKEWMVKPQATVSAKIKIREENDVLAVENTAILFTPSKTTVSPPSLEDPQEAIVWVIDAQGKPMFRKIKRGITNGMITQVREGDLKVGDKVIIDEPVKEKKTALKLPF